MNALLTVTALVEAGAGLALICCPSATASLLLGSPLDTPAPIALGRVAGAALLTLGIANWLARNDAQSPAARALIAAMSFYNLAVASLLAFAGISSGLIGIAFWPAVILHAAMAVWCIVCLRRERSPGHNP